MSIAESNDLGTIDDELPLPDGASVVGEFRVHLNPDDGRMEIWRSRARSRRTPLSQSDLTVVSDDASGSGRPTRWSS